MGRYFPHRHARAKTRRLVRATQLYDVAASRHFRPRGSGMTPMSASAKSPVLNSIGFFRRFVLPALSRGMTYVFLGAAILLLDLLTGRFLQFPVLFVVPVTFSAWFCSARLAYSLAGLLPLGRLLIASFVDTPAPFPYIAANNLIRVAVLVLIAFLVSRTTRQTKELRQRVDTLVTICAWSRTVMYEGEWISFEEYLLRRFNINTSHGISPTEAEKISKQLEQMTATPTQAAQATADESKK